MLAVGGVAAKSEPLITLIFVMGCDWWWLFRVFSVMCKVVL